MAFHPFPERCILFLIIVDIIPQSGNSVNVFEFPCIVHLNVTVLPSPPRFRLTQAPQMKLPGPVSNVGTYQPYCG